MNRVLISHESDYIWINSRQNSWNFTHLWLFGLTLNKWVKLPNCSCHETSGPETYMYLFYSISYKYEIFCPKTHIICLIEQNAFIDIITRYISTVICNIPVLVLRCMSKHLRLIHQTYTSLYMAKAKYFVRI